MAGGIEGAGVDDGQAAWAALEAINRGLGAVRAVCAYPDEQLLGGDAESWPDFLRLPVADTRTRQIGYRALHEEIIRLGSELQAMEPHSAEAKEAEQRLARLSDVRTRLGSGIFIPSDRS